MKKFLLVCFSFVFALSAWAQDRVVSGKVTSPENGGEALPGVNVVLKGTTNGTVTDVSGLYKLTVPASGGTLVFSFIGHETQEIVIGDRTTVDVTMATDTKVFDEVVVTTQGIQREAKTLGYSVATVKGDLINQAKVTNLAAALSAKVSGLQINQVNNGVNGGVRVVLRGNRSFLGNNQALVVLDGVQVNSDYLNTLNPNDVEAVTVLKGANAAALYGSSASNGVLVITTKTGKVGPPELTFSSTTQLQQVAFIPKLQSRFGQNGGEGPGADVFNLNPNFPYGQYVAYENQNYGPQYNGNLVQLGRPLQHSVLINGVPTDRQYVPYGATNGHSKFWNTGVTTQNDMSFSAGDATSHYYVSVQDVNIKGILPKDVSRRDVVRINGDKQYGIFNIAYRLSYTQQHTDTNFTPAATPNGLLTNGQPADGGPSGNSVYWLWMNTAQNVDLTKYKDWRNNIWASNNGWYDDFYGNPYFAIDNNRRVDNNSTFLGNISGSVQATKWLSLVGRLGYTYNNFQRTENTGPVAYDLTLANTDRYAVSQTVSTGGILPGTTSQTYSYDKRINSDVLATASHKFGEDITVKGILGNNVFDDFYNASNISAASLVYSDPQIYNVTYRNGNLAGGTSIQRTRRISYYGDASVTWKYLTVHGSYRNDQTSLLAQNARSFSYPEGDVSFIFTDAIPALKDNQFLNFGKITASIAKVGNVSIDPYKLNTVIGANTPYSGAAGSVPVMYLGGSVVSPSIKPEFTLSKEITLELGLWDEKINFKTAYYQTNTTNQTVPFQISNSAGYSSALINAGEMLNKGLEFDLSVTPISTPSGFTWKIGANFTELITNTPVKIYTSPAGDVLTGINVTDGQGAASNAFAIVGQQYPQLKVTDWIRDPQGRVVVDAVTGLPTRNPILINAGQTNPKHRLGLNTQLGFKGVTLSILVDYRSGNVIYNNIGQSIEFGGIGYQSALTGRQRFVFPNSSIKQGDNYVPNTSTTVNEGNYNFWQAVYNTVGTPYVTSAAFWKLREASLGYNVPKSLIAGAKFIKTLRVSLVGRNLLMWRPKSNLWTDPEFSTDTSNASGTTTGNQLPPTRQYGANVTITF